MEGRHLHPRSCPGRDLAPNGLHPQQRPAQRPAERHGDLEPLRARRLPGAAGRPRLPEGGEDDQDAQRRREHHARPARGRLHLPVPRRHVRPGGQPHRRPAGARDSTATSSTSWTAASCSATSTASPRSRARGRPPGSRRPSSRARASTSTAPSPGSTPCSRRTDGDHADKAEQEPAGGHVPTRLARGALGARRRRQVLPLPQGPGRLGLVAHARLGDAHRLPRPARDRRDPRDVLQARPRRTRTPRSRTSRTTSGVAGSSAACTAGARASSSS